MIEDGQFINCDLPVFSKREAEPKVDRLRIVYWNINQIIHLLYFLYLPTEYVLNMFL